MILRKRTTGLVDIIVSEYELIVTVKAYKSFITGCATGPEDLS